MDVAPGAIAECSGRGAIAGCHRRVPLECAMVEGEGDDQLWGSGRGAIAGCHSSVLWLGGGGGAIAGCSGCGAIAGCHCSVMFRGEGDDQL